MHKKSYHFLFQSGPANPLALKEGLDVALVAATFGHPTELLFTSDGVIALLKTSEFKDFENLAPHGINILYANRASLEAKQLEAKDLIAQAMPLSEDSFIERLESGQIILKF